MPWGPGADKAEDLESAWAISSCVRRGGLSHSVSLEGGGKAALGGKRWPTRASFICCWVSALSSEGKRRGAQPEANLVTVQSLWRVTGAGRRTSAYVLGP